MAIPVIAIVGRPNVGKSTLFNRLTRSRDALVANVSGLTRDRQYGEGRLGGKPYIVIDTGGIGDAQTAMDEMASAQSQQAIIEADLVLFMTDGRAGLTAADIDVAQSLRVDGKLVYCVVNKIDGVDPNAACADFYQLGFSDIFPIAAAHGRGVNQLIEAILETYPDLDSSTEAQQAGIKLAVVGRPNVGKSTFVNRILGEQRVIVADEAGTTRDSIFIPLTYRGQDFTIIDTAGVRRRGKVTAIVEKFSMIKTLQAIEQSNVAMVLIDARSDVVDQDLHLIDFVIQSGKALVLAINKWDGLDRSEKTKIRNTIQRRLQFAHFAKQHFISALHGTGVGDVFASVTKAYQAATKSLATPYLTQVLQDATRQHQPPLVRGRRIKLRYAHSGGHEPQRIIIHGKQTKALPDHYKRFLNNAYHTALKLQGAPLRIEFKDDPNPYQGRKNVLSPSQQRRRKRLIRHVKRK
ncbi:MAG: ribosome biogenesis GTPase Der [Gammaproteobacteria bacterium]